jgi:adenosylhomocysteine nucleosidase
MREGWRLGSEGKSPESRCPLPPSPSRKGRRNVGIVVGLAAEARIARHLGWKVAIGGGTAAGAEAAARRLIDEGTDALVSFGLAGALDPALRPGALIVPATVIVDGVCHPTDPELSYTLGGATGHALLGADAVAASVEEKRRLRDQTSAAAIDLESGAVARVAVARGLPFAALRVVCDAADRALPPAALVALNSRGCIGIWRVVSSLAAWPGQLPVVFALAVDAAAARRALVGHVRQIAPVLAQMSLSLP